MPKMAMGTYKIDNRFKNKIPYMGSDPRIRRKLNVYRRVRKVNRTLEIIKIAVCIAILAFTFYMCRENAKRETQAQVPQTEEDSKRDVEPREFPRVYMSADMPKDYVEPDVAEDKAFTELMTKESEFEPGRLNKQSLACGIGQAYPCTKLYPYATREWILKNKIVKRLPNGTTKWYLPNPDKELEVSWAKEYIKGRYQTAVNALAEWKKLKPCGLDKTKLCNYY